MRAFSAQVMRHSPSPRSPSQSTTLPVRQRCAILGLQLRRGQAVGGSPASQGLGSPSVMCGHSDMAAERTDKFIMSLEKSDHRHLREQQQHFWAKHQGDSRRDLLTPALAMLCAHGLFPGLPGPRSPQACPGRPFSVAPAGPRKSFWREDGCTFSDGSPLAMLNPSSSCWQSASTGQLLPCPSGWAWGHP